MAAWVGDGAIWPGARGAFVRQAGTLDPGVGIVAVFSDKLDTIVAQVAWDELGVREKFACRSMFAHVMGVATGENLEVCIL